MQAIDRLHTFNCMYILLYNEQLNEKISALILYVDKVQVAKYHGNVM